MARLSHTAAPSSFNRASGGRGRPACVQCLPVHMPARFEDREERGGRVAPPRDRVLGDPGLVEGQQNKLPESRVRGVCRRTSGSQDRDAQGLDLRLQARAARAFSTWVRHATSPSLLLHLDQHQRQ